MQQMTHLSRYHNRSPRYILQPQDNTLIRVAGPRQDPWEETTEIKNISLTGLAFLANSDLCPIIGELIKIEFNVPGARQMACYGLVTRLEPAGKDQLLVAIHFQKLEIPHRILLLQGLAQKLKTQQSMQAASAYSPLTDIKDAMHAIAAEWKLSFMMVTSFVLWSALWLLLSNLSMLRS